MEDLEFYKEFLSFEKEQGLFDLQDNQGTYIWDIIRFDIYINLMWNFEAKAPKKRSLGDRIGLMKKQVSALSNFLLTRKEHINFFFLASRNKRDGKLFDQNAIDVVQFFEADDRFLFESFFSVNEEPLLPRSIFNTPQELYRKIHRSGSIFDYEQINDRLKTKFGKSPLSVQKLELLVNNYYSDLTFFTRTFSRLKVKRVFLTQNGIQKGLLAAAKRLNIKSYEFQHGIVDAAHIAYNYPLIDYLDKQVHLPDIIFSLSKFWFKDAFLPGVQIFPLGNNYFSQPILPLQSGAKAITVVSADVFGLALLEFLYSCLTAGLLVDKGIYFKLHPNQFAEKEFYKAKFRSYPQVQVISNEYGIGDLLNKTETVLTIQSTAVYEALQGGRKVILLKESTYMRHQDVFSNENLFLVRTLGEFEQALGSGIKKTEDIEFFSAYNVDILKEHL